MTEVYEWLKSISNGLGLERLSEDFESRGFTTLASLKYVRSADLDVLFPTPQKLKMAEKRILETELENVKSKASSLKPKELFPQSHASAECFTAPPSLSTGNVYQFAATAPTSMFITSSNPASAVGFMPSLHTVSNNPALHMSTVSNQPVSIQDQCLQNNVGQNSTCSSSCLDKRQTEMKQDQDLLTAKKRSVEELLKEKNRQLENYKDSDTRRQKICSRCHSPGHTKVRCNNGPCSGINKCQNADKHPEVKAEIQELKRVLKDLEKKEEKSKNDYDVFKAARERASSSFFAVMRPRLRSQNPIKYVDRSSLDRDLMILKRALANKIPIDERMDWELPFIIERYRRSNVDIFSL